MDYAIVHYSEIGLKGKNRPYFENKLISNIEFSLKSQSYDSIKRIHGRISIKLNDKSDLEVIKKSMLLIPGISHFSFAVRCSNEVESMKKTMLELAKNQPNKVFRLITKRSYDQFKTGSMDINKILGEHLVVNNGMDVNLDNPEIIFYTEITEAGTFI